jgi:hypothetical protein
MQNLPKRRESANARNDVTKASSKAWPRIVKSPQGVYAATKTAVKVPRPKTPPLYDPDRLIDLTAVTERRSVVTGLIHEYRRAA